MHKKELKTLSVVLLLAAISQLIFCFPVLAQECLTTPKIKIVYNSPADLQEMDRRLNFRVVQYVALQQNSLPLCRAQDPAALRLVAKIEGMLSKVSGLLGLNRKNSPRLTIRLFKDGHQVTQIFQFLQPSRERPLFGYGSMQAFYEPGCRTIFLSLKDLHEGILAHEMTHFFLCTGSFPPPPEYYQEDLARDVESRIN